MNDSMKDSLIAFCGHHKGGTVWISKIVASVCRSLGMDGEYLYTPKQFGFDLGAFTASKHCDFICYANADIEYMQQLPSFKGFHVIRDPRDVVVSGYFSHMNSHPTSNWPELLEHREALKRLPKEEGILREIEFSTSLPTDGIELNLFASMRDWDYGMPNVMELKFEEIIEQPHAAFSRVFEFMDLLAPDEEKPAPTKVSRKALSGIIQRHDFARQAGGRTRGQEDAKSHYRKGISGDWRNHFSPRHKEYFKDKFGRLLIDLGYEADLNW